MLRLDTNVGEAHYKALVYGDTGSGKTSFGVTAPKPLILLSERQGFLHVKQAAKRLGKPMPPVLYCDDIADYKAVLRACYADKSKPFRVIQKIGDETVVTFELPPSEWPETVVVDSFTDACRLIVEDIRRQSPPKPGRDGLPVDSERYWNVLGDRCGAMAHGFRDAPLHVIFLCQKDDRWEGEDDTRRRWLGPSLPMRKLPAMLSACCNVTAYAYRREVRNKRTRQVELAYGTMLRGPEYMMLKGTAPLRDVEVADFSLWVRAIGGALEGDLPDAPVTSAESLGSVPLPAEAEDVATADESEDARAEATAAAPPPAEEPPPPKASKARQRRAR